jgi:predicted metal-dependent peptidase
MLDSDPRYFAEFEDACKEMLLRGVFLHDTIGRGLLPADLVEEIKAINQPPIPWQVDLARWIAERFPVEESRRTYARPSRRQSSTPDIPRPKYIRPEDEKNTRTFGVVLDTSGSMDKKLLAQCLGAIASYSMAQEVKFVRLIYCDAQPYDEGYVQVENLINKVQVKGRGGTVLQPAINLLENALDFPNEAPILILSDGFFEDSLTIKRTHAFLVPRKAYLPFMPRGEVFEFQK